MKVRKSRGKLSEIRKKISQLRKLKGGELGELFRPRPMIIGSLYEVYKTCSQPNCCCQKGKKHGPFPALSISIAGKRTVKMVKRKDLPVVREKASAYQAFQQGLAKIRKINKEIDGLLEEIKKEFLEGYE